MATNKNGPCMSVCLSVPSRPTWMDGWKTRLLVVIQLLHNMRRSFTVKVNCLGWKSVSTTLLFINTPGENVMEYFPAWSDSFTLLFPLETFANFYCSPLPGKSERDWLLQVMMNFHWTCANQIEFPIIDRVIWGVRLCRRKAFAYLTETKLHKLIFINNWQMTAINICLILLSI